METLYDFPVSTRRGHALVVALASIGLIVLVAAGVTIFAGAPPPIEPWGWPLAAIGSVVLALAIVRHRFRRRQMKIVRTGDRHHLIVDGERTRLEFPLSISGDQFENNVNRIPMWEVWLKLVDANRRAIFITETRGTIHGPQEDWTWHEAVDRSVAAERYESGSVGTLAKLATAVEQINERSAP